METQFVCQKIMVKKVIVQQCGTSTGNMLQPSVVSMDNVSACPDISYRGLFTYHILKHMPQSLQFNSTECTCTYQQSPGQWKQHLLTYFHFNLT